MIGIKMRVKLIFLSVLLSVTIFSGSGIAAKNQLPSGYPEVFSTFGLFHGSDEEFIVINDSQVPAAGSISFNKPGALNTEASNISTGSNVGVIMDDEGVVLSVWVIPEDVVLE